MRFALLGDHPDGLDMAHALVASGRHELACYCGPAAGLQWLHRWEFAGPNVLDAEEVLADPNVTLIIVAGPPADRTNQVRRALQSEHHVLAVHPLAANADAAHEVAMVQGDTHKLLMPLLPDALHPALRRLRELVRAAGGFRLLELERWSTETVVLDADEVGHAPGLPGWDVLRLLGGEIEEVFGYAAGEEIAPDEPLLVSGRFEKGGLFQLSLVPRQSESHWRLALLTTYDRVSLDFTDGWPGPAVLTWRDDRGELREEHFPAWHPWPALVEVLEGAFTPRPLRVSVLADMETAMTALEPVAASPLPVTWHDAIRCLELDDAVRRSVLRRRASTLEYQEATEEAGFKGTMTLLGCSMLWVSLLLLIMSNWVPWLAYFVVPVFGVFLVMQLFRWLVPSGQAGAAKPENRENPA